jgi:hypothetical protein
MAFAYVAWGSLTGKRPLSPVLFVVAMVSVVASTYTSESRNGTTVRPAGLIWFFLALVVVIPWRIQRDGPA